MKKFLTEPKNALVKQYQRLFEMENTELTFQDEALNVVAKKAIDRRTGARGLRSIMEGILLDTMFDLPGLDGVEQVVVSVPRSSMARRAKPLYTYAERRSGREIGYRAACRCPRNAPPRRTRGTRAYRRAAVCLERRPACRPFQRTKAVKSALPVAGAFGRFARHSLEQF